MNNFKFFRDNKARVYLDNVVPTGQHLERIQDEIRDLLEQNERIANTIDMVDVTAEILRQNLDNALFNQNERI